MESSIHPHLHSVRQEVSSDGTTKVLWELHDKLTVESVILPRALKQRKKLELWQSGSESLHSTRFTACLSSQVGCAMACDFCLTGKQGYTRNLSSAEIVGQVRGLQKIQTITNLVFMGMGEPLQNTENVISAIIELQKSGFSRRKITVSTSGLASELPKLAKTRVKLAVSLNATTDELRSQIMPVNRKFPISTLIQASKEYAESSAQTVMLEYILLRGINDSASDADRLLGLASGWNCKVNLIPYNPFEGTPYLRPDGAQVKTFQHSLVSRGIMTTVRYSGGDDILAACGQLKSLDAVAKRGFQTLELG
jgi:23S rRNA (adenine2503-C2)-methyltransferase